MNKKGNFKKNNFGLGSWFIILTKSLVCKLYSDNNCFVFLAIWNSRDTFTYTFNSIQF